MSKLFRLKKSSTSPREKFDKVIERYTFQPRHAWEVLKVSQTVDTVEPLDPSSTKPPDHTRFVCISDTHSLRNFTHPIPDGDVLIHAGDFTMVGKREEVVEFNKFMTSQNHLHKIVIAGNHDIAFDEENYEFLYPYWSGSVGQKLEVKEVKALLDSSKLHYLEDSEVVINGIRIYGSPWVPEFGNWAFMMNRQKIKEKWDQIPDDTDVLVTHGPPLGYGDYCFNGARAGCLHLLDAVQNRVKPKYHIYGHIHEGYGLRTNNITTFINASISTVRYRPENKPIVFDLPNMSCTNN